MKTGLKPVLWSFVALLLLMSIAVPLLNVLTVMFMMVPIVVLYAILPKTSFAIHLIIPFALATWVIGLPVLIVGLFFVLPSIAMGIMYKMKSRASSVIRTVTLVVLAQMMLLLLISETMLDTSIIGELSSMIRTTVTDLTAQGLLPKEWNSDTTEMMIRTIVNAIPLTFMMTSLLYAILTQYLARRIVNNSGLEVPAFTKAKDWRLPRLLVFLYLITYVMQMFTSSTSETYFAVALTNLVPLLGYVFSIQTIGFFFYLAYHRKWNGAVPILIAIPVLLFPPLCLIGLLDTAFPIRKSFVKS